MPMVEVLTPQGMEEMEFQLKDMFANLLPKKTKKQRVHGPRGARDPHARRKPASWSTWTPSTKEAVRRVEQSGIVFIDEIDKIAGREGIGGPDVSRQGVQRDLLPIVEGSTVNTKHGMVRTDHILFIASGAFHMSKPSDLIPEFQGRFPIRVELEPLTRDDFVRILTEPQNALLKQYVALMADRGRARCASPTTPSPRSPTSPRGSTSAPRTSAPAACTRSWNACSTSSRSTRQKWPARDVVIDARARARRSSTRW